MRVINLGAVGILKTTINSLMHDWTEALAIEVKANSDTGKLSPEHTPALRELRAELVQAAEAARKAVKYLDGHVDVKQPISCGCCQYGCTCHNHMDIPRGLQPKKCPVHSLTR